MKSNILYFHHAYEISGAAHSLAFLISALNHNQFSPSVVIAKRPSNKAVKKLFEEAGARVIEEQDLRVFHGSTVSPCNRPKQRAYAILAFRGMVESARKIVAAEKPDLVHINSTCLVGAAKGAHLAQPDLKVVAHVREPISGNWWGRNLARMNRRHVNWFIGIDQYGLDSVGLTVPRGNVVYNFVDRRTFFPNVESRIPSRKKLGWPENKTIFLSLSRVVNTNGALELARLVNNVEARLPESAVFVVAGFDQNPSKYAAKTLAAIQSSERLFSHPFSSNVPELLNAADVVIAPFVTPHSARSVFEGAAVGLPAMVTPHPNLQELIVEKQTGLTFDFSKPDEFVEAAATFCDSVKRKQMGESAILHAISEFDQTTNANKTMDIYRQLLFGQAGQELTVKTGDGKI